jgi:hypothetical protein
MASLNLSEVEAAIQRSKAPERFGRRKFWEGHGFRHAETAINLDGLAAEVLWHESA